MAEVHWSNGTKLRSGDVRYSGGPELTHMISYGGGVLTTFRVDTRQDEVHWSNGTNLFSGDVRYRGRSLITAMIAYTRSGVAGVLTAFDRGPRDYLVHWSGNGHDLGGGSAPENYNGTSLVTAMTAYTNRGGITGVLTGFDRRPTDPAEDHVVHWSADGYHLGSGGAVEYYAGTSRVNLMTPYDGGVLTSLSRNPTDNVVHRSEDGYHLGSGGAVEYYAGTAYAGPMVSFDGGVLTSFGGGPVHFSRDGKQLFSGDVRHAGPGSVLCMLPYNGGVLTGFTS
jgi:hypothetical protein